MVDKPPAQRDPEATLTGVPSAPEDPDQTLMNVEKREGDPDATLMEGVHSDADPEATFMNDLRTDADSEATIRDAGRTDADAEATILDAGRTDADAEATILDAGSAEADAEATILEAGGADADLDATVVGGLRLGAEDPDATVVHGMRAGAGLEANVAALKPGEEGGSGDETVVAAALQGLQTRGEPVIANLEFLVGLNPLVAAANRLLSAVPQIRGSLRHPDPRALRKELLSHVEKFEQIGPAKGYDADTVAVARYAMCALADESVRNTPWAAQAQWDRQGLLQTLYGDKPDGEKFFAALSRMAESPAVNIDVLEFFDVCLALGFEGKYRQSPGGRVQLEQIRVRLQEMIRRERASTGAELSVSWRGQDVPIRRGSVWFAVWVSACACAAVLVVCYLGFRVLLGMDSEPAARALAQLRAPTTPAVAEPGPPGGARLKSSLGLKSALAKEIDEAQILLQEDGQKSVVTIRGDELFASGSASIDPRYIPIVQRIAQALNRVPGPIVVTGHTDDVPIRTARFSSNWELSQQRARSVAKLMVREVSEKERLRTEGLADSEPLAPNDSAANRAKNRRVTIIVKAVSSP